MEVEAHRKVDLEDMKIKEETRQEFNKLCDQFDDIISKGSDDIGKMLLVKMDINTRDSPPIASKPYTLSLNTMTGCKRKSLHWKERASSQRVSHHGHHQ